MFYQRKRKATNNRRGRPTKRRRTTYKRKRRADSTTIVSTSYTVLLESVAELAANGTYYKSFTFNQSSDPEAAQWAALFDAYRINKVVIRCIPVCNTAAIGTAGVPAIVDVVDWDDSNLPGNFQGLLNYQTKRVHRGYAEWKRTIIPAVALQVYYGATGTGYGQRRRQWLDLANPTVPHYGYKIGLSGQPNQKYPLQIWATVYTQYKQKR